MRWIAALLSGLLAAALWFVLAARIAEPTTMAGPVALLALGFGVAFFPAVFVVGASSARRVFQRALIVLALEGIAMVALAYFQASGTPLFGSAAFTWIRDLQALGQLIAAEVSPLVLGTAGVVALVLSVLFFLALRPPSQVSAQPAEGGARAPSRPGGTEPTRPAPAPKSLPDEDAQLMTDLENLRKKLPK